jgi:hypothetical protein
LVRAHCISQRRVVPRVANACAAFDLREKRSIESEKPKSFRGSSDRVEFVRVL